MLIKKVSIFSSVLMIIFSMTHCKQHQLQGIAVIEKVKMLDGIPSGSGLEIFNDAVYIIGDDAASVFILSLNDYSYTHLPIHNIDSSVYRIDRSIKPDFESAAMFDYRGGNYLLIFGSGSKSPERDSLVIIDATVQKVDTILSLRAFYNHLLAVSSTSKEALNIEGAAIVNKKLVLFNRGNNTVFSMNADAFIEYILSKGRTPPALTHYQVRLPLIGKFEARLSGAAVYEDDVLFSASVEETEDWTKDGRILGSFIGLLENQKMKLAAPLKHMDGKVSGDKIESLIFLRKNDNGDLIILAVADNDDGRTKLMEIRLTVIK